MLKVWPGQVFQAEHYDGFTKSFKMHMFVCLYAQGLDTSSNYFSHIVGAMINSDRSDYGVLLKMDKNKMLKRDSYCNVDAVYTFSLPQSQTFNFRVLGSVDSEAMQNIITERGRLQSVELQQCMHSMRNMAKYEVINS